MLYSIFFHEFLSNENKEGEVLEVLFGKYYLQNFKNFDYGNIKNIDEEIYKKVNFNSLYIGDKHFIAYCVFCSAE